MSHDPLGSLYWFLVCVRVAFILEEMLYEFLFQRWHEEVWP